MMTEKKLAQDSWRAPNWRSRRAGDALDGRPRPADRRDGAVSATWISKYQQFLQAYCQCAPSPRLLRRLRREFPSLYEAHVLYHDPSKRRSRFAIEARMLAGQNDLEIAGSMGCAPKTIQAFAALFFDVRPRLADADYISQVVLGESVSRGQGEHDYAQVWKRVAYSYGPHVLDAMLSGFANPQRVGRAEDVSAGLRDLERNSLSRKAAWATLAVPVDRSTHLDLIDASHRSIVAKQNSAADPTDNSIVANIDAMLKSLPFGVGTRAEDLAKQPPELAEFDQLPVELRADESILLATGFQAPELQPIKDLKFPAEPSRDAP
jgi:hypothetical protein